MSPNPSPFLGILPPCLRLQIYTHLLTTPVPIKGPTARQFQSETYNIHTSILRVSKQIHAEARHVFFGRNTFYINSLSPLSDSDEVGSGAFEPPLQLKDLALVRHLEVDLLYYPETLRTTVGWEGKGWQPVCPAAERYITSLSFLLGAVKESLISLKLAADVRSCTSSSTSDDEDALDVKKFLTGFHTASSNWRFQEAFSALSVKNVELRFDFAESCFDFVVEKEVLLESNLVHVAGQVLVARSEIRMRRALEELQEIEGTGKGEGERRTPEDGAGE